MRFLWAQPFTWVQRRFGGAGSAAVDAAHVPMLASREELARFLLVAFQLGLVVLVIGQFQDFAQRVSEGLHEGDWTTRREIIRALVKRIEIGPETVRVVYKVAPAPFAAAPDSGGRLQDCWRRDFTHTFECLPTLRVGSLVRA